MKKTLKLLLIGFILIEFAGCKDIISEDISYNVPVLLVPVSLDTVLQNPVQFKWEEVKGATKYHLQIVSPSFASISNFVLDTIVVGTSFNFAMDSSVFELKLTALNSGYTSQTLGPIKFWVGLSPSASSNSVVLTNPTDVIFVNSSYTGPFSWQGISSATSFEFSLRKGSSFGTGSIEYTQNNIVTNSFNLPGTVTLTEGDYFWGVKAYFSVGETFFSTRSFQVDVTNPNVPTLVSPGSLSLLNAGSITFNWNNGSDNGVVQSPIYSLIEVSSDSGFTTIVNSASVVSTTKSFTMTAGTYYWRVINTDAAGNSSVYSTINQITIS